MTKEEFKKLWENDQVDLVQENIDDSWRHGNNYSNVYEILDDNYNKTGKFYLVYFRVSGDGEYHGIREGDFDTPEEVIPFIETTVVTNYRSVLKEDK